MNGTAGQPAHRVLKLRGADRQLAGEAAISPHLSGQARLSLFDEAVGPVVSGGRPTLRALLVAGRIVVENDQIPGLDMAQLRADAKAFVDGVKAAL